MPGFFSSGRHWKHLAAGTLVCATWAIPEEAGWEALRALWPTLVALVLVFAYRKVVPGLLAGGFCGALLVQQGNPALATAWIVSDPLGSALKSSWKLSALLFTLLLGGFSALIERGGGLETLVRRYLARPGGEPARRMQGASMGLGLICFFDGLANSILLGRVTRSLARRCGVSREKMAYLVDSTSSSVACIAFISTWIAFQLTLIQDGLDSLGREGSPYLLYFASIPVNYYPLFTLALLAATIRFDFHPGPMRPVEQEARKSMMREEDGEKDGAGGTAAWRALAPLAGLVVGIMGCFLLFYALDRPDADWMRPETLGLAFSTRFGPEAMVAGTLAGLTLAWCFFPTGKGCALTVFLEGVRALLGPVLILVCAWILGGAISELGAGRVITALLDGRLPWGMLAGAVFITGALVSFSTGTSWGTMAILMPLAIPAVFALGSTAGAEEPAVYSMLSLVIAAVFSGAVFGDHCSPFSDTTIVSSIACGVEPIEHVRTQLPYALIAALAALLLGFLPAGLGVPWWMLLPAGLTVVMLVPYLLRR